MLGRGRTINTLAWSGQATHAVAGQLERVVRRHRCGRLRGRLGTLVSGGGSLRGSVDLGALYPKQGEFALSSRILLVQSGQMFKGLHVGAKLRHRRVFIFLLSGPMFAILVYFERRFERLFQILEKSSVDRLHRGQERT